MSEWVNVVMAFAIPFVMGFVAAALTVKQKEHYIIARYRADNIRLERELYEKHRRNAGLCRGDCVHGANWYFVSSDYEVIKLKTQLDVYKSWYLDERAKRLELAEQVRRLREQAAE